MNPKFSSLFRKLRRVASRHQTNFVVMYKEIYTNNNSDNNVISSQITFSVIKEAKKLLPNHFAIAINCYAT